MERRPCLTVGLGFLLVLAAACAASPQGISVEGAMSRPAAAGNNGAAFFTVINEGAQPDRLLSAESTVAELVELHETVDDDGVMKMFPNPEGFEVPAGGRLELKPGGKHVMLIRLKDPLEVGDTTELTLTFERAGPIKVKASVKGM